MTSIFEREHAKMLGIDYRAYYPTWKKTHVKAHRQYLKERMAQWETEQQKMCKCRKSGTEGTVK